MKKSLVFILSTLMVSSALGFTPQSLWKTWPETRVVKTAAPCLLPEELQLRLQGLAQRYPATTRLEEIGQSYLGRSIRMLSLGSGSEKILLWSQMHGDEPSATPALLDIAEFLLANTDQELIRSILDKYTLLMIPMLNPDGAEVYERYNAQGIDINRDALHLVTPEGRLLKRIRDEYEPMLGFNLHDQDRRTAVGDTGVLATNALLAVSGDAENTLTPGRKRTKRLSAAIVEALAPLMPGGMARYDEDWSPRAFGDNITAWGTPVVLIESGGLPVGHEFSDLTRLNFVAILSALKGLVEDELTGIDPQVYEDLPRNQSRSWSDVAVRGGHILLPGRHKTYRADLVFDRFRSDQQFAGCSENQRVRSQIFVVGDASFHGSGINVDASDKIILAPFDVGVKGWSHRIWLNSESLSRLARMGVGVIYWAVEASHFQAAGKHASVLEMQGLPQIRVREKDATIPSVVLSKAPAAVDAKTVADILRIFAIKDNDEPGLPSALWLPSEGKKEAMSRLRKRQPASFLLVSTTSDGRVDPTEMQLISVWLDGKKVK